MWLKRYIEKQILKHAYLKAIKYHVHLAHAIDADYKYHGIFMGPMKQHHVDKVDAHLRCANILRHRLVKLHLKRL